MSPNFEIFGLFDYRTSSKPSTPSNRPSRLNIRNEEKSKTPKLR